MRRKKAQGVGRGAFTFFDGRSCPKTAPRSQDQPAPRLKILAADPFFSRLLWPSWTSFSRRLRAAAWPTCSPSKESSCFAAAAAKPIPFFAEVTMLVGADDRHAQRRDDRNGGRSR